MENPSMTGFFNLTEASVQHRSQWVGAFSKNLSSQRIGFSTPITNSFSVGGLIENNQIDFLSYNQLNVQAAYKLINKKDRTFSIGLGLNTWYNRVDWNKARTPDGSYIQGINHNDVLLPLLQKNALGMGLNFGASYRYKKMLISATVLDIDFLKSKLLNGNVDVKNAPEFRLYADYTFDISSNLSLRPSVLAVSNIDKVQNQINIEGSYLQKYYFGILERGYNKKTFDAFGLFMGIKVFRNLFAFYSYDIPVNTLHNANQGSHEILLKYSKTKNRDIGSGKYFFYHTPRFL